MLRAVAISAEDHDWRGISSRLRGIAIEAGTDLARCHEPSEACDAVVLVGRLELDQVLLERLLRAGKHVLLATDPCLPWPALEALLLAARQSGSQFATMNPDGYLPSQQLIKQQIAANLGDERLVRMHRWEPAATTTTVSPAPLGLPGPLVRDLETVLGLFGGPPRLAYALELRTDEVAATTRHFLQVHLGFAAGMALVDYDNRLPRGAGYRSLSVIGSTGAAYHDDHQNMQLLYRGGHPQAIRTDEGTKHLTAMIQHFADAVGSGRDLSPTVSNWRGVLALVAAVKESIATRQAVHLEH